MAIVKGFDTYAPVTRETLCCANSNGYGKFVGRYYTATIPGKLLKLDEAKLISSCSFKVVSVYQDGNDSQGCFTKEWGEKDGKWAYNYAKDTIGQPSGSAIYFGVDFDPLDPVVKGGVTDYFTAVKNTFQQLGGKYKIGVYGSGLVCSYIKDTKKLADYSWLSMSKGWQGSQNYLNGNTWDINQMSKVVINGINCDSNDYRSEDFGGWWL